MTPEEQRLAIAQACGWSVSQSTDSNTYTLRSPDGKAWSLFSDPKIAWTANVIPDYLNDLNAMHEAEKVLNGCNIREDTGTSDVTYYRMLIDAQSNAEHRAIAFLKTLNLWKL